MISPTELPCEAMQAEENHEINQNTSSEWKANLFGLYSKVFKVMLSQWKETIEHTEEEERMRELDELVLPSNEEWRHQVYYRLVDLQREMDLSIADSDNREIKSPIDQYHQEDNKNDEMRQFLPMKIKWEWEPELINSHGTDLLLDEKIDTNINSIQNAMKIETKASIETFVEPVWRLNDILLAAQVLTHQEVSTNKLIYSDEAEMRRVFGLIYDVLRFKHILNQALVDADFWIYHEEFRARERIVWLLLYDMQGRKFRNSPQIAMIEAREKVFRKAGLYKIEQALIETKIKLAASISRLRIRGSALTLDKLLPSHLRNKGVSWSDENSIASGWINTIKVPTKMEFIVEMTKLGFELSRSNDKLKENHYAFDVICPKVVLIHDKAREQLARSDLVRQHRFIFLERSLCLGAAALSRAIRVSHLCGPVILTHSIAPRHTGYLVGLLVDIEEAGRLLAFGAGQKREEYDKYLQELLGINERQCRVFAESYTQAPGFTELERATIVLTIPPCSYTGLKDIVDLVVARNGDIELLESLTNIDDDRHQFERPRHLLLEQMSCLKYALTKPNVQLLIYEAHSTLPSETVEMLGQAVAHANKMAADKYTKEHQPKKRPAKDSSPKSGGRSSRTSRHQTFEESRNKSSEQEIDDDGTMINQTVEITVPDSDLFEIGDIYDENMRNSELIKRTNDDGCYLAMVRRKEMMQFNSLFMIKVAESKGLFGDPDLKARIPEQHQSKDETTTSPKAKSKELKSNRSGKKSIRLDKITAPTHSSKLKIGSRAVSRQSIDNVSSSGILSTASVRNSCPRYSERVARDELTINSQLRETRRRDARRWWEQSANFLIHASRCESCKFRIFHTDPWTRRVLYPPKIQPIIFNDNNNSYDPY